MNIETITEMLFLFFFIILIAFIVFGIISVVEMANYFMGESVDMDAKISIYAIIGAAILFFLDHFIKKSMNMNRLI